MVDIEVAWLVRLGRYFNPAARAVVLEQHFDPLSPEAARQVQQQQKSLKEKAPKTPPTPEREALSDEVLEQIKRKLNPNFRPRKRKKDAFVPPEIEGQLPELEKKLQLVDIVLQETEAIQYGRKLRLSAGPHLAEINVFFGRRGFSVVKTTKSGTNPELAELAFQVIYEHLMPEDA